MERQLGDEAGQQVVKLGIVRASREDVGGSHRPGRTRGPAGLRAACLPGQALPADHALERYPLVQRAAYVGDRPEVVPDLACCAVAAADDLAADDDGGGESGAQIEIHARIAAIQRAPLQLGRRRRLGVSGHPDLRAFERRAQLAAEGD